MKKEKKAEYLTEGISYWHQNKPSNLLWKDKLQRDIRMTL